MRLPVFSGVARALVLVGHLVGASYLENFGAQKPQMCFLELS